MGKEGNFLRIMVVDDEKPSLDELVYMLSKQENVKIVGAFTSPLEALEASADLKPDAVFLDLSMPHINGAELAKEMRARIPGLKVVFVTAYAKELAKLRDNPAFGSLLKPVSEARMHELLRRLYLRS